MASEIHEQTLEYEFTPSRPSSNSYFFFEDSGRAKEFVELHDQVQTSVHLLDSLKSVLSTFQKDLSAVSGQISELQDRSKDIDNRLKSRRKIEKPLSYLISDITISPSLATLILDSDVGESWVTPIEDFERQLEMSKARLRVKAARDLGEIVEGLRIVAATKLRAFFLALFQPIRSSVTTNMQVIQTSVLLKYRPLFAFLRRQAPAVAHEMQRSYVGAARTYYETGFRRYIRSLGRIKTRVVEKFEPIVTGERDKDTNIDLDRLAHAKIRGPGITLAYMADEKTHKEPIEGLLRSLLLVLMDNATAEYTFITTFFTSETTLPARETDYPLLSPTALLSPEKGNFTERRSNVGVESGGQQDSNNAANKNNPPLATAAKDERASSDAIWKQIIEPVLEYCQAFVRSVLEPTPPVVPLLTMIRLTEDVVIEVQKRSCPPLESFVFSLRLQMWPIFQKAMAEHTLALKKLADGTSSSYFSRASNTTNDTVSTVCERYTVLFNSFITLTEQEEETMIFSNLLRSRQELTKLISRHTGQISDSVARATAQSMIYESLLQGLSNGTHFSAHPKSQQEVAYWANLEEEARRKVASIGQVKLRR